jgi:Ankyrin repeats (3 copies)
MNFKKALVTLTLLFQLDGIQAASNEVNGMINAILKDDANSLLVILDKFYKKNKIVDHRTANSEVLITALLLQKTNVVLMLLNRPINLDVPISIDSCDRRNGFQHKHAYEIFCEPSFNSAQVFTEMSLTPLQATCMTGDLAAMKMLINAGAKVQAPSEGENALSACFATKNFVLADFLIDQGANVKARNFNLSPLMTLSSVSSNDSDQALAERLAEKMISKGADPRYIAKGNYSELYAAAGAGNLAIVKLLVQLGAEINAKSDSGLSPLSYAEKNNKSAVIDFLKSKGAQR